jgi:hypothetical protein
MSMTLNARASSADRPSQSTSISRRRHVPVPVEAYVTAVRCAPNTHVYNLTVEGTHEYLLANGMLSKNCDSLRYWAMSRPMPGSRSAVRRAVEGSIGWWLTREQAKPKGILAPRRT